ncbi:MAG: glycosyltransferase family 1 protein [Bacteroidales bacterium]
MTGPFLHIIAFNVPYPPDYGGVIDIYYKLKALHAAGARIILHCFTYGRQPSKELGEICFKVHYYPRQTGWRHLPGRTPYIVSTRKANSMPNNVLQDSFPVLFEGLHTTAILNDCKSAGKRILVRTHNIEHVYYRALARTERQPLERLFFYQESIKLRRYESILGKADHILAISRPETDYFRERYGNAHFIPAFHKFDEVSLLSGTGDYVLFHGNLGVAENEGVLRRFALPALSDSPYPVVIAGKNPSASLKGRIGKYEKIRLVADPSDQEMEELIRNAQVNLLLTGQSTGIKLKLLHCLFTGRHCLVNRPMVEGTGLDQLCTVVHQASEIAPRLNQLMNRPVESEEVSRRKKALKDYSNRAGAEKILRLIS